MLVIRFGIDTHNVVDCVAIMSTLALVTLPERYYFVFILVCECYLHVCFNSAVGCHNPIKYVTTSSSVHIFYLLSVDKALSDLDSM